jgi:hypothetical protein
MNNADLEAAFRAHKEGQTKFTRRMAIIIADMADMKPMSLVWRLEKMGLLKRGSWEWFKYNGGITKAHIAEVRGDLHLARQRGDTSK